MIDYESCQNVSDSNHLCKHTLTQTFSQTKTPVLSGEDLLHEKRKVFFFKTIGCRSVGSVVQLSTYMWEAAGPSGGLHMDIILYFTVGSVM